MTKFDTMTKKQLEAYGRDIGIELDRRMTKEALVATLITYEELSDSGTEAQVEFDAVSALEEIEALEEHPVFAEITGEITDWGDDLPHGGPDNDPLIQESIEPEELVPPMVDVDPAIVEQELKDKLRMLQNMHEDVIQAEARAIASGIALAEEQIEHDALAARAIQLRANYEQAK